MKTQSIQFEINFPASPKDVYQLLLDPLKHALICEGEVKMTNKTDGKFEVYGGYCHGYNIQLIENEKIVQAWHFEEDNWPSIHYSICTFDFEPTAEGCKMIFEQIEVPETSVEALISGWKLYYWDRMQDILKANN